MTDSKQKRWRSKADRRIRLAKLRCRLGRHHWQRIRNPETGDTYDRCHYCEQLKHVEVTGNSTDQARGVTSFGGGGFGGAM